ncbi:unnamed protein product [Soboliphyme baturini]|uniref:Uncharacterized protein n=1 Tax=Soboliphyme baturini TaxID=241478 RepID=A0A183IYG9_9BILA|nr:unnamed protein product [Soboliphyme baturini]
MGLNRLTSEDGDMVTAATATTTATESVENLPESSDLAKLHLSRRATSLKNLIHEAVLCLEFFSFYIWSSSSLPCGFRERSTNQQVLIFFPCPSFLASLGLDGYFWF